MKRHRRRHKKKLPAAPAPMLPVNQPTTPPNTSHRWLLLGGLVLLGPLLVYLFAVRPYLANSNKEHSSPTKSDPVLEAKNPPSFNPPIPKKEADNPFLEAFGKDLPGKEESGTALANEQLEKRLQDLAKIKEQIEALNQRVIGSKQKPNVKDLAERQKLQTQLDSGLSELKKAVGQARRTRPGDPVVDWLAAEILIFVGSEPELILPLLQKAIAGGVNRPRLFASLAKTQVELNQFGKAFQTAKAALDHDDQDQYVWQTFGQTAFHLENFKELIASLDRAFHDPKPHWAEKMYLRAVAYQARWQAEQKLRLAEDNLPLVRIVVEHRRFKPGSTGTVENTGAGEFVVALFEDQAPATVANFINLVEQKVYDGTRFYLAVPAFMVAGGDPDSKTGDPADDGSGGPGYVIPDEYNLPGARQHFRGSVSMVNTGPHTSGSQFFINLSPKKEMDGLFTAFGRVIKGMEVVDKISRGRTNHQVGRFGQIIPGDILVHAEVVRKRAHEYRVVKEAPK